MFEILHIWLHNLKNLTLSLDFFFNYSYLFLFIVIFTFYKKNIFINIIKFLFFIFFLIFIFNMIEIIEYIFSIIFNIYTKIKNYYIFENNLFINNKKTIINYNYSYINNNINFNWEKNNFFYFLDFFLFFGKFTCSNNYLNFIKYQNKLHIEYNYLFLNNNNKKKLIILILSIKFINCLFLFFILNLLIDLLFKKIKKFNFIKYNWVLFIYLSIICIKYNFNFYIINFILNIILLILISFIIIIFIYLKIFEHIKILYKNFIDIKNNYNNIKLSILFFYFYLLSFVKNFYIKIIKTSNIYNLENSNKILFLSYYLLNKNYYCLIISPKYYFSVEDEIFLFEFLFNLRVEKITLYFNTISFNYHDFLDLNNLKEVINKNLNVNFIKINLNCEQIENLFLNNINLKNFSYFKNFCILFLQFNFCFHKINYLTLLFNLIFGLLLLLYWNNSIFFLNIFDIYDSYKILCNIFNYYFWINFFIFSFELIFCNKITQKFYKSNNKYFGNIITFIYTLIFVSYNIIFKIFFTIYLKIKKKKININYLYFLCNLIIIIIFGFPLWILLIVIKSCLFNKNKFSLVYYNILIKKNLNTNIYFIKNNNKLDYEFYD